MAALGLRAVGALLGVAGVFGALAVGFGLVVLSPHVAGQVLACLIGWGVLERIANTVDR